MVKKNEKNQSEKILTLVGFINIVKLMDEKNFKKLIEEDIREEVEERKIQVGDKDNLTNGDYFQLYDAFFAHEISSLTGEYDLNKMKNDCIKAEGKASVFINEYVISRDVSDTKKVEKKNNDEIKKEKEDDLDEKVNNKKKRKDKNMDVSNKFKIYDLWKNGTKNIEELSSSVNNEIKKNTIKAWMYKWGRNKSLPKGAKDETKSK